jgi:hypothetical protein
LGGACGGAVSTTHTIDTQTEQPTTNGCPRRYQPHTIKNLCARLSRQTLQTVKTTDRCHVSIARSGVGQCLALNDTIVQTAMKKEGIRKQKKKKQRINTTVDSTTPVSMSAVR